MADIPVVSLVGDEKEMILKLDTAFRSVGFVFVLHHGILAQQVNEVFRVAKLFFDLPLAVKEKYARSRETRNNGYGGMKKESLDPSKPGDLKEFFNMTGVDNNTVWPDSELPDFRPLMKTFYTSCHQLVNRLLELMGKALQLEDVQYFINAHSNVGDPRSNATTLRLLHYPPISSNEGVLPGQLRCGEHVDYGSITLLFQDSCGGLQVRCTDGGYIDVPCVDGAVLVNLGALMQRWTADVYRATPHRVLIPKEDCVHSQSRQSVAFFAQADNTVTIQCIDGSDKYPPIRAEDDLKERFLKSYGYGEYQ